MTLFEKAGLGLPGTLDLAKIDNLEAWSKRPKRSAIRSYTEVSSIRSKFEEPPDDWALRRARSRLSQMDDERRVRNHRLVA